MNSEEEMRGVCGKEERDLVDSEGGGRKLCIQDLVDHFSKMDWEPCKV